MKKTISEITEGRGNRKCYLFENNIDDFFVIHGSYFREVEGGDLYNTLSRFKKKEVDWKYIEKRIKWDRDEEDPKRKKRLWSYIPDVRDKSIDVESLYIDGEEQQVE